MVQPIHYHNNELNSLKELKMSEVRIPVEELLEMITESLFEAEAKMQNRQEKKTDEFNTCVKISQIITSLEFIIQELKNIRTQLYK